MGELPITEKSGHTCNCGHSDEIPVLDARELPHAIRHGAILGSIAQLKPGAQMHLIAPHNPLPLLDQVRSLHGDAVEISYVSEDPWTIAFKKA